MPSRRSLLERLLFPEKSVNGVRLHNYLRGKTIVITGASSGIGEQLALQLAQYAIHMILIARREEKLNLLKTVIESQQARVTVCSADLRVEAELERVITTLQEIPEGVHIVVSNAGHSIKRSIHDSLHRYHDFSRTMAINYEAPVRLLLALIPILQKTSGHIINVSTINMLLPPFAKWSAYQASKAAFNTWMLSVQSELQAVGIASSSIYFPLVRTAMIAPTKEYNKVLAMTAEHAADIIVKVMSTQQQSFQPWWTGFAKLGLMLVRSYERLVYRKRLRKGRKRNV